MDFIEARPPLDLECRCLAVIELISDTFYERLLLLVGVHDLPPWQTAYRHSLRPLNRLFHFIDYYVSSNIAIGLCIPINQPVLEVHTHAIRSHPEQQQQQPPRHNPLSMRGLAFRLQPPRTNALDTFSGPRGSGGQPVTLSGTFHGITVLP